jgi:glutathione peroxidase
MFKTVLAAALALALPLAAAPKHKKPKEAPMGVHQFTMNNIDHKPKSLADYKGKVLLVVNVASECGNTPQYKGLEAMYLQYKGQGLEVLGFPSNDFGHQEPGTEKEIKDFCDRNYHVTFDMFAKTDVLGDNINPLYKYLTTESGFDGPVSWNFAKFLVGKDGKVIARFGPKVQPDDKDLVAALEKALKS